MQIQLVQKSIHIQDPMTFLFEPQPQPYLPIKNSSQKFPVRRIYCVGRNYADHAREMGHDPDREPPFFFQKNPDNLLINNADFPYPSKSNNVHFEIELVVALDRGGINLSLSQAENTIFGYAVGLDMTRRDLQSDMKKMGRSWEIGKAFEHSAPCSSIVPKADVGTLQSADIWLNINRTRKQSGNISEMIWNVAETISYLSGFFKLQAGDIIMTGTPAGVGAVSIGDEMHGHIDGVGDLKCKVT